MAEVYYYVPKEDSDQIVECGLKLSQWFEKDILIEGINKKCIVALLNPKDDIVKFNDDALKCLKLELSLGYCYVADSYLYDVGLSIPEIMKLYHDSIVPLEKYIFGLYRLPECLVTTTAIPGQINVLNKAQDIPVLFNCSEELYLNNLMENNRETCDDFDDRVLYYFYSNLARQGIMKKIEKDDIAIFIDDRKDQREKVYTIRIPEEL